MLVIDTVGAAEMGIGVGYEEQHSPKRDRLGGRCLRVTRWTNDMGRTDRASEVNGRWMWRSMEQGGYLWCCAGVEFGGY